jgi:DNA-binding IscR family transcriptional regulator
VISERGGRGGLYLSRPPEEITVLDIVNAVGIPALNRCTVEPSRCDRRDSCAVYRVWVEAQTAVERVLGRTRLSEVIERQAALTRAGRGGSLAGATGGGPP